MGDADNLSRNGGQINETESNQQSKTPSNLLADHRDHPGENRHGELGGQSDAEFRAAEVLEDEKKKQTGTPVPPRHPDIDNDAVDGLDDGGEQEIAPPKPLGKSSSKPLGKSPKSAALRTPVDAPAFVGKPLGNSLPEPVGKQEEKPLGISVGKQARDQQKQQLSRTEWYRYELDFRQIKKGCWVLIRKRLRWSDTRYSKTVVRRFCPQLTKKMVEQISVGKFSQGAIAALLDGGIQHGFIAALQDRIGKGNGKRRTDLTDFERSLLARIESSVRASNRGGTD